VEMASSNAADEFILVHCVGQNELKVFKKCDVLPMHLNVYVRQNEVHIVNLVCIRQPHYHGKAIVLRSAFTKETLDEQLQENRYELEVQAHEIIPNLHTYQELNRPVQAPQIAAPVQRVRREWEKPHAMIAPASAILGGGESSSGNAGDPSGSSSSRGPSSSSGRGRGGPSSSSGRGRGGPSSSSGRGCGGPSSSSGRGRGGPSSSSGSGHGGPSSSGESPGLTDQERLTMLSIQTMKGKGQKSREAAAERAKLLTKMRKRSRSQSDEDSDIDDPDMLVEIPDSRSKRRALITAKQKISGQCLW
jgi:hypothetical protein